MLKWIMVTIFERWSSLVHLPLALQVSVNLMEETLFFPKLKYLIKKMKETTLLRYFIKVTARLSFTWLKIIRQINRVYLILKWKIRYTDSVVPSSNLNVLAFSKTCAETTNVEVLQAKVFLEISQNLQENTCISVSI